MDLKEKLINYLRSGFSSFWLKTNEPNRLRRKLYQELETFVRKDGQAYSVVEWTCAEAPNALEAIKLLESAEQCTVLFAYNWHWFSKNPQVTQHIQNLLPIWASQGKAIIFVSPTADIPMELKNDVVLLEMPLPKESEIESIIRHIAPNEKIIPAGIEMQRLVSACKGLTGSELESILSLSVVESNGKEFLRSTINDHKSMAVRKTGFLSVIQPNIRFSDIVGYNEFKNFVLETIDNPKAKGIMAIGPNGCGKTSLMKAIVGETGRLGISVNMGSLFSKYQGETDQNINFVIDFLISIGDCFVLIDEFEKQFSGAGSDGTLDSGTTRRATGRWLDFLQSRPEGIYITGTANSFVGIPGEYLRPGRWDTSPFYVGLPSPKVKIEILKHYLNKEGLTVPSSKSIPKMEYFSGAEIEAMVHIASMRNLSLEKASTMIKPMAITKAEDFKRLENWAKDCAISAEEIPLPTEANKIKRRVDI